MKEVCLGRNDQHSASRSLMFKSGQDPITDASISLTSRHTMFAGNLVNAYDDVAALD